MKPKRYSIIYEFLYRFFLYKKDRMRFWSFGKIDFNWFIVLHCYLNLCVYKKLKRYILSFVVRNMFCRKSVLSIWWKDDETGRPQNFIFNVLLIHSTFCIIKFERSIILGNNNTDNLRITNEKWNRIIVCRGIISIIRSLIHTNCEICRQFIYD